MGPDGLRQVALACCQNLSLLKKKLTEIDGVEVVFNTPVFNELVLRLPKSVDTVLQTLAKNQIQGGFSLTSVYPELGECLLICVTETKTERDLDGFVAELSAVLKQLDTEKKSHKPAPIVATV